MLRPYTVIQLFFCSPGNIQFLKVNYRNVRKRNEICSAVSIKNKLAIKKPQRRHWLHFGFNFKHYSYFLSVFLQLTLNMQRFARSINHQSHLTTNNIQNQEIQSHFDSCSLTIYFETAINAMQNFPKTLRKRLNVI